MPTEITFQMKPEMLYLLTSSRNFMSPPPAILTDPLKINVKPTKICRATTKFLEYNILHKIHRQFPVSRIIDQIDILRPKSTTCTPYKWISRSSFTLISVETVSVLSVRTFGSLSTRACVILNCAAFRNRISEEQVHLTGDVFSCDLRFLCFQSITA